MSQSDLTSIENNEFDEWKTLIRKEITGTVLEGVDIDLHSNILKRKYKQSADIKLPVLVWDICAEINLLTARHDQSFVEIAGEQAIALFDTYVSIGNVNRAAKLHGITREKAELIYKNVTRLLNSYHHWYFGLSRKTLSAIPIGITSLSDLRIGIESGEIKPDENISKKSFLELVTFCQLDPGEILGRISGQKEERKRKALQRRLDSAAELLQKNGYEVTKIK